MRSRKRTEVCLHGKAANAMCCCHQVAALERQALLKQQGAQAAAGALARLGRAHASQRQTACAGVPADPVLAMQRTSRALEVARTEQQSLRCDTRRCQANALTCM